MLLPTCPKTLTAFYHNHLSLRWLVESFAMVWALRRTPIERGTIRGPQNDGTGQEKKWRVWIYFQSKNRGYPVTSSSMRTATLKRGPEQTVTEVWSVSPPEPCVSLSLSLISHGTAHSGRHEELLQIPEREVGQMSLVTTVNVIT